MQFNVRSARLKSASRHDGTSLYAGGVTDYAVGDVMRTGTIATLEVNDIGLFIVFDTGAGKVIPWSSFDSMIYELL